MRTGRRSEHGFSLVELVVWAAAIGGVVAVAWYVISAEREPKLTEAQQSYVVAVATQRAESYIHAVATQQSQAAADAATAAAASVPPPASAPEAPAPPPPVAPAPPPPVAPAPPPPAPPAPPPAPPAPPPAPPPPPPPPAPSTKSPMAMCVGYMVGLSSDGLAQCQQIAASGTVVGKCVGDIIAGNGTTATGKADCLSAAVATNGDAYLTDCLLGLSGQSFYGKTSCRQYYARG